VTVVAQAPARSPRTLGAVCAGLAVSAALLWGASAVVWTEGRTGAQVAPSLTGVALLALAGVAGVLAAGGIVRRLVGGLLAVAGAGQAVAAAVALGSGGTSAPLLAVAGGAVLLVAGVLVVLRERRLPKLGARYAAAGDRRVPRDPDRAAWEALDAGEDPTAGPGGEGDDGTGDGRAGGRG
jgi:hypothetical protein